MLVVRKRGTWLYIGLSAVLLVAAALRLCGLEWDGGIGAHPDERYVVGVAEGLRWPNHLNPFEVAPDFAYGHLPVYLLVLAAGLARGVDPLLVGRALAAAFDVGTVALTFALGRRAYGERTGLLAAAFIALMVLHVQQAHFYTADVLLTFFTLGALLFAVRLAERGRSRDAALAGLWAGLALGSKFSAGLLALPLGAAWAGLPGGPGARWRRALESGAAALAAFTLTNPFAVLAFPTFWHNVAQQASIARGALDVPYTRQFHATWPYVYPIVQQLRWGMGWPLGLVALGGLAYGVWRAVREPPRRAEWVLLAWSVPVFTFTGALYARFPRYWLPLTPVLAVYAAHFGLRNADCGVRNVDCGLRIADCGVPAGRSPLKRGVRHVGDVRYVLAVSFLIYFPLIYSLFQCLAFVNIYRSPHPWVAASEWLYEHVPRGAVVAVEQWDHPLPLDASGYEVRVLPVFDEDGPEKWAAMEEALAEADVVVVASQRGYGTLARWPARYPLMAHYYRALFEGRLGFKPVACFERYPRLGPLVLVDDPAAGLDFALPESCRSRAPLVWHLGRLDESLVVYDHPLVVVWQR